MRTIISLLLLVAIVCGGWALVQKNEKLKDLIPKKLSLSFLKGIIPTGGSSIIESMEDFSSLEARYKPQQIIEKNFNNLANDKERNILSPTTIYYPYVLLEVKYAKDTSATGEGQMLWGLEDGEMVINASTWETTHGFEDCINAHTSADDFKVINILAKHSGRMDRENLLNALHVESKYLDGWIENLQKKKLVVLNGNHYRLHFENAKLNVVPETMLKDPIVAQRVQGASRISPHYSITEVELLTKAAFGQDFFIRRKKEVYLPVYKIGVKNPDGSTLTSYWNAYTGTRFNIE